ncbi:hypothetical protein NEFER02_0115 [Nematocida sp. LUAm2]|nr:hypothetical protein NEFER02_0115 [Nematocida sp. LUAm2]
MEESETLQQIKEISEELLQKCKHLAKWISTSAQELHKKFQNEKQQIARKQELLEATIIQLKEENAHLLDERQRLALETETEQLELEKLKEEQKTLEKRVAASKKKSDILVENITMQSTSVLKLRRVLHQEEQKAEDEAKKAYTKIEQYKEGLGMRIEPQNLGSVSFIFKVGEKEHFFTIETGDTYTIHKASIEEKKYAEAFQELKESQDLFAFIKEMRNLFTAKEKENSK